MEKWRLRDKKMKGRRAQVQAAAEYARSHRKRSRAPPPEPLVTHKDDKPAPDQSEGTRDATEARQAGEDTASSGLPPAADGAVPGDDTSKQECCAVLPSVGGYQAFFEESGTTVLKLWASLQDKECALAAEAAEAPPPATDVRGKAKPAKGKGPAVPEPAGVLHLLVG
jgi:hypothetical protein